MSTHGSCVAPSIAHLLLVVVVVLLALAAGLPHGSGSGLCGLRGATALRRSCGHGMDAAPSANSPGPG